MLTKYWRIPPLSTSASSCFVVTRFALLIDLVVYLFLSRYVHGIPCTAAMCEASLLSGSKRKTWCLALPSSHATACWRCGDQGGQGLSSWRCCTWRVGTHLHIADCHAGGACGWGWVCCNVNDVSIHISTIIWWKGIFPDTVNIFWLFLLLLT